jgi:hypothetical protein
MRDRIHEKFSNVFEEWKLNEFKNMFGGPDKVEKWEQAKEYTNKLDTIRDQNISDYLTEFKDF